MRNGYIVEARPKNTYKFIPKEKVWINRHTPVGEDAEYYQMKPHGGKTEFYPVLEIEDDVITYCFNQMYSYTNRRWEYKFSESLLVFIKDNNFNHSAIA